MSASGEYALAEKVARMERQLAQYALIPDDYPDGWEGGTPDLAVRRLRSWASLMSETHVGLDQQVRACAWSVLRQLDEARDAAERLWRAIDDAENAILGSDNPSVEDQRLHAALAPLWGAARVYSASSAPPGSEPVVYEP